MAIIFENIITKETYAIDREREGKFYLAKLSALMNSSNMNPNADRGQDFGVRLAPEQQALIEQWEQDPDMIERVSKHSGTFVEDLTHADFLGYMLFQQELGNTPERGEAMLRREAQRDYEARVEALKVSKPEQMKPFSAGIARGEATVDDFLSGDLTGDAGGDKEEPVVDDEALAALDKVIDEVENSEPPVVEQPVLQTPEKVGTNLAKKGEDKTAVEKSTTKKPSTKK